MSKYLKIENSYPLIFRKKLVAIVGGDSKNSQKKYIVEELQDGTVLEIRKPGFKGDNDFQVWIDTGSKKWMPTFEEILKDLAYKILIDKVKFETFYYDFICNIFKGKDPDDLLLDVKTDGLSYEYILKVLKWWFGEEDCNYPISKGYQGRKMIMYRIRELLDNIPLAIVIKRAKVEGKPPLPLAGVDYKQVDYLLVDV